MSEVTKTTEAPIQPEPVEIKEEFNDVEHEMRFSESIGNLAEALAKAQGSFTGVGKGKQGYGYKYADLASVIDTSRKGLSENNLSVVQTHMLKRNPGKPSVLTQTILMHSSGEWIKSSLEIPLTEMKQLTIPQIIGVACSYGRRYAYQAIVGIAAEEDTDGTA